ncbi:Fc.00g090600.m01.CDS01 [Cosmosporella sp. VM-42]
MDVPEAEFDIKLQKISGDLLGDFDRSLPNFLWKPDGHGGSRVRSRVRSKETFRLTSTLLDPFQELPQLLDPYLPKWIPLLSEAFLKHLQTRHRGKTLSSRSKLLVSVEFAICKILYTFCKIRGEKVIVRFLNVETKYLELLLLAIEESEQASQDDNSLGKWSWEERYVVLLWLSHLLLAPFDLSTISSVDLQDITTPDIPGLRWPENLPAITVRMIPLAIKYLSSPGKERDAAKSLLVRMSTRRDMQQLGVLESLVHWSLASLRPQKDRPPETTYFYLGVLSFLAGLLRSSSDTSDMNAYLPAIFYAVHAIATNDNKLSKTIISLALARKMILKVIRTVIVLLLRQTPQDMVSTELTEIAIGYLLESVGDTDTPVRFAASKALSIITLKLDADMASQVVEAVLESLNRNVLWLKTLAKPVRDLSAVSNLEWHGLMLTLSHLLYRRSPPANQLSDIVHALLLGLSFEQRSMSGGSIGSNVRDAACFGVWAVARRYTTQELLAVPTHSVFAAKAHPASSSILQVLGTELVVSASLDPAGNIRRGASAALQELIGRHPDTVEQGIWVVQTVDYHAVARRSRAIQEVALGATKLASQYGEAIMDTLLGWRGIGDLDAPSRRVCGTAFGVLTLELSDTTLDDPFARFKASIQLVTDRLKTLQVRQVEERHGLLLFFAAALDQFPALASRANDFSAPLIKPLTHQILKSIKAILEDLKKASYRRPELIAEAASQLVVSSLPILQAATLGTNLLQTGQELLSPENTDGYLNLIRAVDSKSLSKEGVNAFISSLRSILPAWLNRNEPETIEPASAAGLMLLIFSELEDRKSILEEWALTVRNKPTSRTAGHGIGYQYALTMAQPLAELFCPKSDLDVSCRALLERWNWDHEVDTRVAILQSLTQSRILYDKPMTFLSLVSDGLDDYTTNARGDVGSHVRVQALRAVKELWRSLGDVSSQSEWLETAVQSLFLSTIRLSAEKLDRVRPEAQAAVALALQQSHAKQFRELTFSSKKYFQTLLNLYTLECLHPFVSATAKADTGAWMSELLAGFVTSADTGNEDLVIASRAALSEFCEASSDNLNLICNALLQNLKTRQGQDRVTVPTLEIIAFLFHVGLFQKSTISLRSLCIQTQKASYKTGNVRKIEACIKVYGGVARMQDHPEAETGVQGARKRLGALLFHPWSRVRSKVVDELWGLFGDKGDALKGVDWGQADKPQIRAVVEELRLG